MSKVGDKADAQLAIAAQGVMTGLTLKEIAQELGASEATARRQIQRLENDTWQWVITKDDAGRHKLEAFGKGSLVKILSMVFDSLP